MGMLPVDGNWFIGDKMLDFGFYNMDCMDGMREFPDNYFDLAIVDPPYGIGIGTTVGGQIHLVEERQQGKMAIPNPLGIKTSKPIQVGGVSASHPKSTRHLMIAPHQMLSISRS